MIVESDLPEVFADLVAEPVVKNVDIYRRAEKAARRFVNETYGANVDAETIPAVRMLSWYDLPTAISSLLRYPADLARAQLYGWSAWLNYLESQQALLCEHAGVKARPQAAPDRHEIARIPK